MNPIQLSQHLHDTFVSYLTTTFDVNRDGKQPALAAELRRCFESPLALFNGPFLELTPPYQTGKTLNELVAENVLDRRLLKMPCFAAGKPIPLDVPLYSHQEQAIRKLCVQERNIVVSSGTGSGKTECFLLPILNDLIENPAKGVRAVIIYPMNALVNDQLDRLRYLLKGTDITFGRYTGETPTTEKEARKRLQHDPLPNEIYFRDQIRQDGKLPQILITNYAMLEYLLLRPKDAPLFGQGSWKYIVLDEAHSYAGAQGIEVSFLLRRLKHRLGKRERETRCIATSATLTTNDAEAAVSFAQNLFGEPFETSDVIFGQPNLTYVPESEEMGQYSIETLLHPQFDDLLYEVRIAREEDATDIALNMAEIGLLNGEQLALTEKYPIPSTFLWHILKHDADLHRLRQWMGEHGEPVSMNEAAAYLFSDRIEDEEDRLTALHHLVELGAMARPFVDETSLLPARYHLFARPPQGIWVCLNPNCAGRRHNDVAWSQLFSTRRDFCPDCQCAVYPLHVCRTCGQSYLRMEEDIETRQWLAEADPLTSPAVRYLTWEPVTENLALAEDEDEDEEVDAKDKVQQQVQLLCLRCQREPKGGRCGCESADSVHIELFCVVEPKLPSKASAKSKVKPKLEPIQLLNQCCRCRDTGIKKSEIATAISLSSTTPLAIITSQLYRQLSRAAKLAARQKAGEGRKLLTFYDSRQGAARFAAFLQDIATQNTYRHLIPNAVKQYTTKYGHRPDFVELEKLFLDLGWDQRVFHTDMTLDEITSGAQVMRQTQRKRLGDAVRARLLAEFSTRHHTRQSLESLGVVALSYFEEGQEPDFELLAKQIGLTCGQTRTLLERLLDELRREKVITLPDGVKRDDAVFGRNVAELHLVRQNIGHSEVTWMGMTERHRRRRMVRETYERLGKPIDDPRAAQILSNVYDWMVNETRLFKGTPRTGYQLNHARWHFHLDATWYRCDQCRRLTARGTNLSHCPHARCHGTLHPANDERRENYYFDVMTQSLIPMRVEEHTAQLETEKGREYQEAFKEGEINVLSCSTTFEMGIDLGDLEAVVLSNIPPSVSNYKQRAGRAGRRTSGTAFILAWAANRPHDQTHFSAPKGIISGRVRVPHIAISNREIFQRHINALLFSAFLRHRAGEGYDSFTYVGAFFDAQVVDHESHYSALEKWVHAEQERMITLLRRYVPEGDVTVLIRQFSADMQEKAFGYYQTVANFYKSQIRATKIALIDALDAEDEKAEQSATWERKRYTRLLARLREKTFLINFLSERGVLPSYSFPLHTVNLQVDRDANLRLQRDVRLAIREYAPGQEIVADKRIWRSHALNFYGEEPRITKYRICHNCNSLQIGKAVGFELANACPTCGEPPKRQQRGLIEFIIPDDFRSESKGEPARQYVHREQNLMRSALIPSEVSDRHTLSEVVSYGYSRDGELLYVNEGTVGIGFKLCRKCGMNVSKDTRQCTNERCKSRALKKYALGFRETTDTLHLEFQTTPNCIVPDPEDNNFWWSLQYALLQGACRALQIERRDIDGVLFPRKVGNGYQQSVVLYDDVPGGAGHVKQIMEHLDAVIAEALRVVNCENCGEETSCVRCLRDYTNQWKWNQLERGAVVRFLEAVQASLGANAESGITEVIALHRPTWLMQTLRNAQHDIWIAAEYIDDQSPDNERDNWLDVLQEAQQRNVKVNLVLKELPKPSESLLVAHHLRLLIGRGMQVWQSTATPTWQICLDATSQTGRVLQAKGTFALNGVSGADGLSQSIRQDVIDAACKDLHQMRRRRVESAELRLPPRVEVRSVQRGKRIHERELVGDLFEKPVRELVINDRYLVDEEVIKQRLGAYVALAAEQDALQSVSVYSYRAGVDNFVKRFSADAQTRAFQWLENKYGASIQPRYRHAEHDRSVILHYTDGTCARLQIGKGLDFIRDGVATDNTSIIVEKEFEKK